ncbi:DNA polymerase III subunit epsilon [Alphaproteobacteria bacterium]|nr:DNA polymerase III subunit epsilon [Alphaproteobacteria bacterium]MDA8625760.1 DNA polymerase III subunit epsilon [Alphaproteobacteria bacterium]MDA8666521.1 DNA polymerase III subunit epsilon [Alphaproteobacteria bacterium]MDB2381409.1 DNA polymerase III subunit epsilon [Alphaproteobacteria bacterium]MDB2406557.1 DNA polymerase III subunit epsilon [Alphaproteobacteria bacterium]
MREIVLDTETTGLDPASGDRIVEIGCLELVNRLPTGQTYHVYINPERDMPREAEAVHGLSAKFLSDKPLFAEIADEFAAFVKGAALIIHNASFDMKFLNAELAMLGRDDLRDNQIIDTLAMARKKFPGAPASLDALCRRFGVDNSNRDLHGALIDSELLAGVYLELSGGRQPGLVFQADAAKSQDISEAGAERGQNPSPTAEAIHSKQPRRRRETPLAARLTEAERAAHQSFLQALPQRALWLKDDA